MSVSEFRRRWIAAKTFPARNPGQCVACCGRIREGDPIVLDLASGFYRHGDCDNAEPAPAREHPVCPVCWLTHPEGACDR